MSGFKPVFYVILQIPRLLFLLLRIYFRFRITRWAYLRRFRRVLYRNLPDNDASGRIFEIQRGMLNFRIRDIFGFVGKMN